MRTLNIETTTHGRILIEDPAGSFSGRVLVGFHGYGQSAGAMLDELRRIPGADGWRLVSVQGLHRFYTRNDQAVVASWMTREDREHAIADNIVYVNRVVDAVLSGAGRVVRPGASAIVFLGFSQGASMAARAAARGSYRAAGLILLGGDIPNDVKDDASVELPPVLIGCGDQDTWYGARVDADVSFLASRGFAHDVIRFAGGHEFTQEFSTAVGEWLAARTQPLPDLSA